MRCKRRCQPESMNSGVIDGLSSLVELPCWRQGYRLRHGVVSAQEPADAAEIELLRKQAVGSMRLIGTLAVGPGGAVTGHVIDHADKVLPEVLRDVHAMCRVGGW